jgi:hypothetical protein
LGILGLSDAVSYDIGMQNVRLAITQKDLLMRAMVIAGSIFHHRSIVKIISKRELDALIKFIGQETYSYILKRGMVLWKMVPEFEPKVPPKTQKLSITEKIFIAGKEILCRALFGLPDEIKKRLELMFGEQFDIPTKCDELLIKKCLDLVKFSLEKAKTDGNAYGIQ